MSELLEVERRASPHVLLSSSVATQLEYLLGEGGGKSWGQGWVQRPELPLLIISSLASLGSPELIHFAPLIFWMVPLLIIFLKETQYLYTCHS